jgi:HK97 gp10 family phage protein
MAVTVSVSGHREAAAAIRRLAQIAPERLKQEVNASAIAIQAEARRRIPVDTGIARSEILIKFTFGGLAAEIGAHSKYGIYLEFGTRPHWPPIAPLEEWARRHGMPPGTGYLIARKIARTGTPAVPFLFPAYEGERQRFIDRCKAAVIQATREAR